jgi:molybdopterin molybdotransferase
MTDTVLTNATPDAACAHMLSHIDAVSTEIVDLDSAQGRTLGADIVATRDQPPFAGSSMDGYAVASAQTPGGFLVVGTSAAGVAFTAPLQAGQTCRIFTGAPLPVGADGVAIQEDVTREGDLATIPAVNFGQHVRQSGVDFKAGHVLFRRGQAIDPINSALIGAAGYQSLVVSKRPTIAILTGGDEIVAPGQTPLSFQIFDSITVALTGLLEAWGATARSVVPRRDELSALQTGLAEAFGDADLVVTVGGASVGDLDLMKPALQAFKPTFLVDKIAVRPGKPTWFAKTQYCPVLGLPGNPASALVCAHLFLKPIVQKMLSQNIELSSRFHTSRLIGSLAKNGLREHYLRAVTSIDNLGQSHVKPAEQQDSALLSVFAGANCLVRLAPNLSALNEGDLVDVMPLHR